MADTMRQPVTPSAAVHAERIRARAEERADGGKAAAGQSTAERIAARILPGYRADEELRERARLNELRARGVLSADQQPEDVEEGEEYDDTEEVEEEDEEPVSTAERYARRERRRIEAGRAATRAAHRSVSQAAGRIII